MATDVTVTRMDRRKFQEALTIIHDNVEVSDISEMSNCFIFQNNRVHGFNDVVGVTVPLGDEIPNCAVDSELLFEFIRKLPSSDKEIRIGLFNGALRIRGTSAILADFPIRTDLVYPEELIQLDTRQFIKLPETFENAMTLTAFACDPERVGYERVVLHKNKAYGAGSGWVNSFDMGEDAAESFPNVTFVSPSALSFITKYSPKKYMVANSWLHLYTNDMKIYSSRTRSDSDFNFDWAEDLLADVGTPEFTFPANIKDILERANPFSGKTAKIKNIIILIKEGKLQISAIREDGSAFKEIVRTEALDDAIRFNINLKLIQSIVPYADYYKLDTDKLLAFGTNFRSMMPLRTEE